MVRLQVVLALGSAVSSSAAGGTSPQAASGDVCTLSAQPGVPVNPQLFGYNLEVFGTMMNNSMSDTGGMAIADALHLGTLRYPGGTMSNVWDSQAGR